MLKRNNSVSGKEAFACKEIYSLDEERLIMDKTRLAVYWSIISIVTVVLVIPGYSGISPNLIANSLYKLSITHSPILEPVRMLLLGAGLIGLASFGRRKMKRRDG